MPQSHKVGFISTTETIGFHPEEELTMFNQYFKEAYGAVESEAFQLYRAIALNAWMARALIEIEDNTEDHFEANPEVFESKPEIIE